MNNQLSKAEEEMRRQPDESKMDFIKRTIYRCYRKRIAKSELSLLLIDCPIRPSNAMKKTPVSMILNVVDKTIGDVGKGSESGGPHTPTLTEVISSAPFYNRR